jgi:hypothetical protein
MDFTRIILLEDPWKVSNLHRSALDLHKTPQKEVGPCNVALGDLGRCGSPDSGELAGELGRGVVGEAPGVAGNRLGCLLAAETVQAGGHIGGRRRRPLEVLLRRAGSLARATSERGSYRRL